MKRITLKKLKMSNWRGQTHDITFNEGATRISGANGAGKSSIMHAFFWCITGFTDGYTKKNNNLFDNRAPLDENTPWASVEIEIEVDGIKYEIQRRAKPKFVRSKGSMTYTKSPSDSYEYYVDSIEVGATGFNNFVEHTLGVSPNMINYCLSGEFFSSLIESDKEASRRVLTELAGEVKPEDFKGDYSSIEELLKRYSASDIVEMSRKKKKPLEERQNVIPVEIDRKEERLSELRSMDFSATEKEIEKIKGEIEAIDGLLLGNSDAVKPILEHNREIENKVANKRLSLVNGRLNYKEAQNARTSEIKAKIAEIKRYNENVKKENDRIILEYDEKGIKLAQLSDLYDKNFARLETLRKRKNEIKERVFTDSHCPYCGAELDPTSIEEKKAIFARQKTADLTQVVEEGKAYKAELERIKVKMEEVEAEIEAGYTPLEWQNLIPYEEALARVEASFIPYEETDEFKRINAEIEALMSEIKEVPSNDNESLTSRKKTLIDDLSELSKKLGLKDEIEKVEKDIEDLKKELRNVACSIAELEKLIYISKQWEDERNNIVSYRVNDNLDHARIQMFSTQKNGDVVSDCLLTNKRGVRMASTNFSDRILIAIDMQMLFMKKMDIRLPIWVDESAVFSSSNLPHREGYQMIFMFPSDSSRLEIS